MPAPTSATALRARVRNSPAAEPHGGSLSRRFDTALAALGPFEPAPLLAVAVSGGADSMALLLLARDWAARRGGRAVALTVDHRLRPGSAAEARRVAGSAAALGLEHRVLRRRGPVPAAGLQAMARDARYALLTGWCRRRGVLHLLLGHQAGDQRETVAMRASRGGSQAGMSPLTVRDGVRLLRPLLAMERVELESLLRRRGQEWLEDPSNDDLRFERVRMRRRLAARPSEARRLDRQAGTRGRERQAAEVRQTALLAATLSLHPAGFAWLDATAFARAPLADRQAALSRVLRCLGNGAYPPQARRVARLVARIAGDAPAFAATLAGCRVELRAGRLLICREAGRCPPPVQPAQRGWTRWDRFLVRAGGRAPDRRLGALGADGWAALPPACRDRNLPLPARGSLPAIRDGCGLLAVPQLCYARDAGAAASAILRPRSPLFPPSFMVV